MKYWFALALVLGTTACARKKAIKVDPYSPTVPRSCQHMWGDDCHLLGNGKMHCARIHSTYDCYEVHNAPKEKK